MLCEICHEEEATVHLKKIINDEIEKIHMCEACAMKKGISPFKEPSKMTSSDLLAGISSLMQPPKEVKESDSLRCERCGITFREFQKIGKLGCPQCFVHFRKNLISLLRKIHGATRHSGKVPANHGLVYEKQEQVRQLKKQMQIAATEENYEEAASIRDIIYRLEKELTESNNKCTGI